MSARLLVVFVMSFSGVAFGDPSPASTNPSVEERLAILETTMKLQYEALSKQMEANHQATLKQMEANHQSTLKLIEVTNNRIDTLNNWLIALFGAMVACVVAFVTYALGLWRTPKRDKTVAMEATANSPEVSPTARFVELAFIRGDISAINISPWR